jgi:very-short-patch-repair endonuclease
MRQPLNNRRELKARRRELRGSLTIAEARLWSCVQHGRLGWKFRRQHSIGPFVVDFYCPSARLAIELDGAAHDSDSAGRYDERRSQYLRSNGIVVVRFLNEDVLKNLEGVLAAIRECLSDPHGLESRGREPHHSGALRHPSS